MRELGKLLRLNLLPKTALIMALGWHQAGGHGYLDALRLLRAAAAVAVMWAGLYAFNHWADAREDALDPQYGGRPLVSGAIRPGAALAVAAALTVSGAGLSFVAGAGTGAAALAMVSSQVAYCGPGLRLKHTPLVDVLLVDIVNPWLRFFAGSLAASGTVVTPPLPLAALAFLHLGNTLGQKLLTRERDLRLGWSSTGVLLPPAILARLAAVCTALGAVCIALLSAGSRLGLPARWGALPAPTLLLFMSLAAAAPLYARVLRRPAAYQIERVRTLAWRAFALAAAYEALVLLRFPR